MKHLTGEALSAHLDGATTRAARERVEAHLAGCETCRAALAELAAREADLRSALEHDPGDAYFETFAARVEDRIRARGLKGAQSRLGVGGWLGWLRSPRRLAWVGAAAAVIGGAAIVILSSHEIGRPMVNPGLMEPHRLLEREQGATGAKQELATRAPSAAAPGEARELDRDRRSEASMAETKQKLAAPEGAALLKDRTTQAAAPPAAHDEQALDRQTPAVEEARSDAAAPSRLQQTQRAAGEDVPMQKNFAEPPKAAMGGTSLKAAKPQAVPMQSAPSADAVAPAPLAAGQTRLCGRVVDPNGRPVAGAVVALADRGLTVSSDGQGGFCMDVPEGLHELSAMAIGYEPARLHGARRGRDVPGVGDPASGFGAGAGLPQGWPFERNAVRFRLRPWGDVRFVPC
jgi:anti-sigma factor RsiW